MNVIDYDLVTPRHIIMKLAELKSVFDRFAVHDLITAPEMCQALTESGLTAPRRCVYMEIRVH